MTGATVVGRGLELITGERLVAIVRMEPVAAARDAALGLADGGVRAIEFSLTARGALRAISDARSELDPGVLVGAGTVMDVSAAHAAVDAGAAFLVSPNLEPSVVAWAADHGVLHIPGVMTPTEAACAHRLGAPLIKLFPAGHLGPSYVRALLEPLPGLRLVPTGGVDLGNAADFLTAGAVAVAVGGALAAPGRSRSEIAERAAAMRDRVSIRGEQP